MEQKQCYLCGGYVNSIAIQYHEITAAAQTEPISVMRRQQETTNLDS